MTFLVFSLIVFSILYSSVHQTTQVQGLDGTISSKLSA